MDFNSPSRVPNVCIRFKLNIRDTLWFIPLGPLHSPNRREVRNAEGPASTAEEFEGTGWWYRNSRMGCWR